MEFMTGEWFGRLVEVLVVNLILSGDNAVVIAMAARTLEGANRRRAIVLGAAGAVVLRLIFAGIITCCWRCPCCRWPEDCYWSGSRGGSSTTMGRTTRTR